uniref:GAGE domain-containing protein n=1 Tax=Equus asinus TaxID=9793 RepID=A0A8C4LBM1_EQUAS
MLSSAMEIGPPRSKIIYFQPDGPLAAQQSSDKQPQQEELPTESQDILPGPDLEADQQELAQPKTGGECGGCPEVKGMVLPNFEPIEMPEIGEGQPWV